MHSCHTPLPPHNHKPQHQQDALEIASTLAEAFLAAKFGDEVEAVAAVGTALPTAVRAGAFVNVTAADGPAADNTTAAAASNTTSLAAIAAKPLAALRNITINRQRMGLDRRVESAPERRNVSLPVMSVGSAPPNPSWMMTSAPGDNADVYQR